MNAIEPIDHRIAESVVQLAKREVAAGRLPFVSRLIYRSGHVTAPAINRVESDQDPTAHAEIAAIREAAQTDGVVALVGATLYTSCSPCILCYVGAHYAGIGRIVYTVTREEAGAAGFDLTATYTRFPVESDGWGPEAVFTDVPGRLEPFPVVVR